MIIVQCIETFFYAFHKILLLLIIIIIIRSSYCHRCVTLGAAVLESVLDRIGSFHRKVAVGVDNESGYKWTALNVFFYSGKSDVVKPHEVESGIEISLA